MNITITLQAESRLITAIEAIANALSPVSNTVPEKKTKLSVVKETPVKQEEPKAVETPAPEPTEEKFDLVKVRALVAEASQAGKKEAIKSVLKEFNVARVTDLPEDQYPAFVTKIQALKTA